MDKQKGLYYGKAPKDEDLITPVLGQPMCWRRDRIFCRNEQVIAYFTHIPPFDVMFQFEAGDFEVFNGGFIASPRPNWWQRLKIRYKIWRLRCKIRKALAKR